jgi:hypothetical protein
MELSDPLHKKYHMSDTKIQQLYSFHAMPNIIALLFCGFLLKKMGPKFMYFCLIVTCVGHGLFSIGIEPELLEHAFGQNPDRHVPKIRARGSNLHNQSLQQRLRHNPLKQSLLHHCQSRSCPLNVLKPRAIHPDKIIQLHSNSQLSRPRNQFYRFYSFLRADQKSQASGLAHGPLGLTRTVQIFLPQTINLQILDNDSDACNHFCC